MGDYKNSSNAYNLAINLDQDVVSYYKDYAKLLLTMGRKTDCDKCYEDAINILDSALGSNLSSKDREDIIRYKKEIRSEAEIS